MNARDAGRTVEPRAVERPVEPRPVERAVAPRVAYEPDTGKAVRVLRRALEEVEAGRLIVTTAFGPGGMSVLHLLRGLGARLPVVFIDTLYHFPETLAFAREVARRWDLDLRIYQPAVSRRAFEAAFGPRLWERDLDRYHELTKVEPMRRALPGVRGWITARRRDQASTRRSLSTFEDGDPPRFNPLAAWSRDDVWRYVHANGILYHPLHDRGYASVGDQPLTTPIDSGEHERAGRWRGLERTECGLHFIGRDVRPEPGAT